MFKKLEILPLAIFLLLAGAGCMAATEVNTNDDTVVEPVNTSVCAQDVRTCPDGSYVGRVPPTCEFAVCPMVSQPVNGPANVNGSGMINGNTTINMNSTTGTGTGTGTITTP